ncbi:hypothetical protein V8C35DRAFT_330632 [Trichoderma chlorosporum]
MEEEQPVTGDRGVDTTYSFDTISDDLKLRYLQDFTEQLTEDMKEFFDEICLRDIEAEYLKSLLRDFAWKLHSESVSQFQWGASVTIYKRIKNIIKLLVPQPPNGNGFRTDNEEAISSEDEDHDEFLSREDSIKPKTGVEQWVNETSPLENEEVGPFPKDDHIDQLLHYKEFIRESDAYHWLLAKIRQYGLLNFEKAEALLEIRMKIWNQLGAQEPLRRMSSWKRPFAVKMTFSFDWDSARSLRGIDSALPYKETLSRAVCLTGSWNEGQAATVRDYMDQTWPRSGHTLIALMQTLLSIPEGQECSYQAPEFISSKPRSTAGEAHLPSEAPQLTARLQPASLCCISVTGPPYFVSEISEQIGWLASALQSFSDHHGPVACTPSIKDLQMVTRKEGSHAPMIVGSCNLTFNMETRVTLDSSRGFCWGNLFCDPVLVRGYPTLRRSKPNTGLEMPLANMAAIVGSQQVVRWGERIIIKGFNMLMIATMAAADIIVWHLLVSEQSEDRISYIDSRLDTLDNEVSKEISLRTLEEKRHIIGWCSKVTDMCGDATANLEVESSGLPEPPASIVIDRLYIRAGADFAAGFDMSLNNKEKPFWLERENDYPSLLKWISVQPIVFYDVTDRRAWLTDGASALLHLVRISLYLDQNDPGTVYEWVFDTTKFKDTWDGITGRQAALETLKSWDNLNLNIYVVDKKPHADGGWETKYATLETRVKKILHSIEVLIDKQVMSGSQDGIRILQAAGFRHDIIGFDIRDIVDPSRGHGWIDFIPSIGTTTIFGRGFGDLIKPEEPLALCREWKSVPVNKDYMAATVSTLQMLYTRRLLRMEPSLGSGEIMSKIPCECLKRSISNARNGDCHIDSVQFLVAKGQWNSWKLRLIRHKSKSVDVMTLDEKGAVIFGPAPPLSQKNDDKFVSKRQDKALHTSSGVEPTIERFWWLFSESRRVATQENSNSRRDVTESKKKGKKWRTVRKSLGCATM